MLIPIAGIASGLDARTLRIRIEVARLAALVPFQTSWEYWF
jgi:hypothetical protein